jgi:hypothetical protein
MDGKWFKRVIRAADYGTLSIYQIAHADGIMKMNLCFCLDSIASSINITHYRNSRMNPYLDWLVFE